MIQAIIYAVLRSIIEFMILLLVISKRLLLLPREFWTLYLYALYIILVDAFDDFCYLLHRRHLLDYWDLSDWLSDLGCIESIRSEGRGHSERCPHSKKCWILPLRSWTLAVRSIRAAVSMYTSRSTDACST